MCWDISLFSIDDSIPTYIQFVMRSPYCTTITTEKNPMKNENIAIEKEK